MKYGYTRISAADQSHLSLENQKETFMKNGVLEEHIFVDTGSGASLEREELQKLFAQIKENDTVVITQLDRLGRNMKDLLELIHSFEKRNIKFVSLDLPITDDPAISKLVYSIFASLSEFERARIKEHKERQREGTQKARLQGRYPGRKAKTTNEFNKQVAEYRDQKLSYRNIAQLMGCSPSTVCKAVKILQQQKDQTERK